MYDVIDYAPSYHYGDPQRTFNHLLSLTITRTRKQITICVQVFLEDRYAEDMRLRIEGQGYLSALTRRPSLGNALVGTEHRLKC